MKKMILPIWQELSLFILSLIAFQFTDEFLSRREILYIILILVCGLPAAILSIRRTSGTALNKALLLPALVSFVFCLWTEVRSPLLMIPPQDTVVQIDTAPDFPVDLTWAYWSRPDTVVNEEIETWHPSGEIRRALLTFEGSWTENDRIMQCSGQCSVSLKRGFRLDRPIFAFSSDEAAIIQNGKEQYTVTPGIPLRIFGTGNGLSRQFVFTVLFLAVWGILSIPSIFLSATINSQYKLPEPRKTVPDWPLYLSAFLLPMVLVCAVCWLLRFYPFGEKTYLITDMQCQYVDYLLYFRNVLRGGKSLFYSFSKSLGDDFLSLYAYYLGNPLNWLTALFPVSKMPTAAGLIIILRYGLCGLTSSLYFRKVFRTSGETIVFSTAYALISLQFVIGEHIQLREGAILLPLILLGIERLLFQDRTRLYIITLCAALLISYYSAYQICFYCVLYFLFRSLMTDNRSWKQFGRFAGASLISALLCAVFLIPVALQLTKGMKTFDPAQFTLTFNMRFSELAGKLFSSAFDMDQTLTSGLPNIFSGLFITTAIPLFFLNRSISGKEKLLTGLMLLLFTAVMQIRALNLILHGFNEPVWWPYRYSFIICLFLITIALRCYQERGGITFRMWILSAMIVIALLLFIRSKNFGWFSENAFYLNLLLCACMFILWLISPYSGSQQFYLLILVLSGLDLLLNGWMILGEKTAYQRAETVSDFQQFFDTNQPILSALEDFDKGFYRTEKTYYRDANDALTLGYHGIGHYSSTLNYNVMKFLPKMGYRYYPWRFLYAEGSDLAADSLLGIRYLISDQERINKPYDPVLAENGKTVFQNPFSLPIAFFARDIQIQDPDAVTFELQNGIFEALSGENTPIYKPIDIGSPSLKNLAASAVSGNRYERIIETDEASITWTVPAETGKNLYLYLRNDSDDYYPVYIYINGEYLTEYFDGKGLPIVPIPDSGDDQGIEITLVPKGNDICFDEIQIYSENTAVLGRYSGMLGKSSISLRKKTETSVSGEITAEEDGYLFFSIPYDKGWKIMIDGSETPAEEAFDIFLSAPVSAGDHIFEIRFLPEGLETGSMISAGALLILLLNKVRKKRHSS